MIEQTDIGKDGRFTAFGRINGRAFVADGATLEEATEGRRQLKQKILPNVVSLELAKRRMMRANTTPFNDWPPNDAA